MHVVRDVVADEEHRAEDGEDDGGRREAGRDAGVSCHLDVRPDRVRLGVVQPGAVERGGRLGGLKGADVAVGAADPHHEEERRRGQLVIVVHLVDGCPGQVAHVVWGQVGGVGDRAGEGQRLNPEVAVLGQLRTGQGRRFRPRSEAGKGG